MILTVSRRMLTDDDAVCCDDLEMQTLAVFLIALVLAIPACRPTPPHSDDPEEVGHDIVIAMDRKAYDVGDVAQVTIANTTDRVALFALVCDAFVEGRARDRWQTVFAPDCSNVRVIPTRLGGGDSMTTEYRIECTDEDALPRYYAFRLRIQFQFEDNSGYRSAYSSWFTLDER